MNKYRVTVELEVPVIWEGEAVHCSDALLQARAYAEPERWRSYEERMSTSATAPGWPLFRDLETQEPIRCKVEKIG